MDSLIEVSREFPRAKGPGAAVANDWFRPGVNSTRIAFCGTYAGRNVVSALYADVNQWPRPAVIGVSSPKVSRLPELFAEVSG
jgi:hypothetical protein